MLVNIMQIAMSSAQYAHFTPEVIGTFTIPARADAPHLPVRRLSAKVTVDSWVRWEKPGGSVPAVQVQAGVDVILMYKQRCRVLTWQG